MSLLRLLVVAVILAIALACNTSGGGKGASRYRVVPDEPWRQARPPARTPPELKLPDVQRLVLKNGLALFVVEDHSLPIVSARVVVRAGPAQESEREAGLAALTWELLDEGAGSLNQLALAEAVAALGTQLHTSFDLESGTARVELMTEHAEQGLKLLADVVRKPGFAAADFERVRGQALLRAKERLADPAAIADNLTHALIYGSDHPYGRDPVGTADTLSKLAVQQVRRFWTSKAGPRNAALILAGDITLEEAKALAQKYFGSWSSAARPPTGASEPTARTAPTLAMVDMPGASHSTLRIARAGLEVTDPDLPALIVLNTIVGGTFSSRLNLRLSEERQWTNQVHSQQVELLGRGPWSIAAQVRTAASADAVIEALAILEDVKGAVTNDELERAKVGWTRALPGLLGTPSDQAAGLGAAFALGAGPERFAALAAAVGAVSIEDVKRVAERVIVKDDLVIVLVGDRASVLPKLKEAGLPEALRFGRDGFPE